jgi:hypothetical protein
MKQIGLPVYKASYNLLLYAFQLIKNMRKDYKYTAGEKIREETMELVMNIYRANKIKEKKEKIEEAQENIQRIRLLFRLLYDLEQISLKHFTEVNKKIEDVSRQLTGWRNAQQ